MASFDAIPLPDDLGTPAPVRVRPEDRPVIKGPGRPDEYLDRDGRYPLLSASGVSKAADDNEGLLRWFAKNGLAAYRMRDSAADTGTAVHDAIEAHIHGQEFPSPDMILGEAPDAVGATNAFAHYLRWREGRGAHLAFRATEIPFLSDALHVGGTVDLIAESDEGIEIYDWKTSSQLRRSHVIQLSIYALLYEEEHGIAPVACSAVRLPKTPGGAAQVLTWGGAQLEASKDAARHLLEFAAINKVVGRSLGL